MNNLKLTCAGCFLVNILPKACGRCLETEPHKYKPLLRNYELLHAGMISKDEICSSSVLNRMYKKSMEKLYDQFRNDITTKL